MNYWVPAMCQTRNIRVNVAQPLPQRAASSEMGTCKWVGYLSVHFAHLKTATAWGSTMWQAQHWGPRTQAVTGLQRDDTMACDMHTVAVQGSHRDGVGFPTSRGHWA